MEQIGRILLIEDDAQEVELTLVALEKFGLDKEVIVVNTGEEALDYLHRRGKFDSRPAGHPLVVFLDLEIPSVNGLEVLKQIKTSSELKMIPVVLTTPSREEPDINKAYALGVNACMVKPADSRQFMDTISQAGLFWVLINEPPPGSVSRR